MGGVLLLLGGYLLGSQERRSGPNPTPTPAPISWGEFAEVPLDPGLLQMINAGAIDPAFSQGPATYHTAAIVGDRAFVIYTAAPADAGLLIADRGETPERWTFRQSFTTRMPPERMSESHPEQPIGFTAPLPGGPYVSSTAVGVSDRTLHSLYASSEAIVLVGLEGAPVDLTALSDARPISDGRVAFDQGDATILVSNHDDRMTLVAVVGTEATRAAIEQIIDWARLERLPR